MSITYQIVCCMCNRQREHWPFTLKKQQNVAFKCLNYAALKGSCYSLSREVKKSQVYTNLRYNYAITKVS